MTSTSKPEAIAEYFDVDEIVETAQSLEPSYNVAPTQDIHVIAQHTSTRKLGVMKWGLVPFFSKDATGGARMINARAESVVDKPAYRRAFAKRRCLIPADGFYEWEKLPNEKRKQPWHFRSSDNQPLAFAGLWETWRDPALPHDAAPLVTCTIITTEANADMGTVHNRMPLVLPQQEWDVWLDVKHTDPADAQSLLQTKSPGIITSHRVSDAVNRAANNDATLTQPID